MHACSPFLLWSYCTHQRYNIMVRTAMKSCSSFNSDLNKVFLLFCTYSQYCNMTKRRWGNRWVNCGPQIHTHQRSNGMVWTVMESCSSFNSYLNKVFLLFCTYSQYCIMTKRRWGNGVICWGVWVRAKWGLTIYEPSPFDTHPTNTRSTYVLRYHLRSKVPTI